MNNVSKKCVSGARTAVAAAAFALLGAAGAEVVRIVNYDVDETPASGFGCWNHAFSGTIVDTGRTVGGSVICAGDGHVLNYRGGSGTLNDKVFDTTHLLLNRLDNSVPPKLLAPVIRLNLDASYKVEQVRLLRGDNSFTTIDGLSVEIEGDSLGFAAQPIPGMDPLSVSVSLQGTALGGVPTRQVTLKNFTAVFFGQPIDQFGIGEIEIVGTKVLSVPTQKEQCRNGGWKAYSFRNQGQCVSFVNHR
ncbi:hypothetical protein [Variovorax saccharolyticus]|uniref:hypothetical protein n=1 Tax=Variovorax saccharolyticus TaxID=3053516 RepID=UPI002574B98D|nr:hypothetical protein [Variovorax sp. J31P216]MDM0025286.1 hypothetical protein [Variovorax sp. J31P216]